MNKSVFLCTLLIILIFAIGASGQPAVIWEETFAANPGTWTLENNWTIELGKLWLNWSPQVDNYDLSATSPVIELPVNVGEIIVNQYVDTYSPVDEIAEISIIYDGNEDVIWSYEMTMGNWGSSDGEDLIISLMPYSDEDVQIKFRSYGTTTYNFDAWNIYNLAITASFDDDLSAQEVLGPPNAEQNIEETWSVKVKNTGQNSQSNFTVKLMKEGDIELGSQEITAPLESDDELIVDFTWTPANIEETYLYGEVTCNNDEFAGNNTTGNLGVYVYEHGALQVLIWDNDNNSHYDNENGQPTECQVGLEEALSANFVDYETVISLPGDLSNYDIVFVELGAFCVG